MMETVSDVRSTFALMARIANLMFSWIFTGLTWQKYFVSFNKREIYIRGNGKQCGCFGRTICAV